MRKNMSVARPFTDYEPVKKSDRIIIASESIKSDVLDADAHNAELLQERLSFPVRRTPIADVVIAS